MEMHIPGLHLLYGTSISVSMIENENMDRAVTEQDTENQPGAVTAKETVDITPLLSPSSEKTLQISDAARWKSHGKTIESGIVLSGKTAFETVPNADPIDIALVESSDGSCHDQDEESNEDERYALLDMCQKVSNCAYSTSSESENETSALKTRLKSLENLDDDADDAEDPATLKETRRTRNEIVDELNVVNLANISVSEDAVIESLGCVESLMDSVLVVRAGTAGEIRVLDEGSVIVNETRSIVGRVSNRLL
jgi:hypothetical protein